MIISKLLLNEFFYQYILQKTKVGFRLISIRLDTDACTGALAPSWALKNRMPSNLGILRLRGGEAASK
jgi:hypothetical protein